MKFVEFLGLPGSGKTTIADSLIDLLSANGHRVVSRRKAMSDDMPPLRKHGARSRYVLGAICRHPAIFYRVFRLIQKDGQSSARAFAKVCWNMWCVLGWYDSLDRNAKDAIVIVDQGLAQAVWSVRLSALRSDSDWAAFLTTLPVGPGLFAIVVSTVDVAQQRLAARTHGRSRLSDADTACAVWRRGQEEFNNIRSVIDAHFPTVIIRNDADDGIAQSAAKLEKQFFSDF